MFIKNYEICLCKDGFYEKLASLIFLPSDYKKRIVNNGVISYTERVLETTVKICKERLEIFGVTIESVREEYEKIREKEKDDNILDFDTYISSIKRIIRLKTTHSDKKHRFSKFQYNLIDNDFYIKGQSDTMWIYSILYTMNEEDVIKYELTWLINNESGEDEILKKMVNPKIIVLTEGNTDTEYIKKGLKEICPHLADYYFFMDFIESEHTIGASMLVNKVKLFVGSGIKNQILAIFENDTAGVEGVDTLKKMNIPENIVVLEYQEVESTKDCNAIEPLNSVEMQLLIASVKTAWN